MSDRSEVRKFLEKHGMWHAAIPFEGLVADILSEMERGLSGERSSLAMIPTYLRPVEAMAGGEPVLAIDAGGTNFRAALVSFGPKGAEIEGFRASQMPGIGREVGRQAFFDALASGIVDLARRTTRIGFCFSYPMLITPERDGKLLHFTKEIRAPEVEGTLIGVGLVEALGRAGAAGQRRVALLNDTTATLLAGRSTAEDRRQYDSYVGFIFGTGTNTAYVERSIPKAPEAGEQIVVLESGGFAIRYRGDLDEAFDATTLDPGRWTFEKMQAGGYLGGLCLAVLQQASREGLLAKGAAARLLAFPQLATKDLAEFLARPFDGSTTIGRELRLDAGAGSDQEVERVYLIADSLVERASMLAAAALTAVVVKSGRGGARSRPVCIAVDGTTWRETPRLALRADCILEKELEKRGQSARVVTPANATLLGSAVAALAD